MYILLVAGLWIISFSRIFLLIGTRTLQVSKNVLLSSFTPIWAWLFLNEIPILNTIVGGKIILTTLIINTFPSATFFIGQGGKVEKSGEEPSPQVHTETDPSPHSGGGERISRKKFQILRKILVFECKNAHFTTVLPFWVILNNGIPR